MIRLHRSGGAPQQEDVGRANAREQSATKICGARELAGDDHVTGCIDRDGHAQVAFVAPEAARPAMRPIWIEAHDEDILIGPGAGERLHGFPSLHGEHNTS